MTKPNIHTLTIEGEETQTFNSVSELREVLIPQLRANPNLEYKKKEIGYCPQCGEQKKSHFTYYCDACSFKNDDTVKASRKIIRSAKRHGNPVVAVWDGGETIKGNERELLETVHGVDVSKLILESGAQVLIVGGNESEVDCVSDYHMSIEDIITDAKLKDEPGE